MPDILEVKIPDIGDFDAVPVIDVMVKPGDVVKAEDSILTLESEKATMDVPSPAAGTVKDVKVKIGDKVSQGSLVLLLEVATAPNQMAGRTSETADGTSMSRGPRLGPIGEVATAIKKPATPVPVAPA